MNTASHQSSSSTLPAFLSE